MNKNQVKPSKDGDVVRETLKENASKARTVGRSVVFTIIATLWAITYSRGVFHPTNMAIWALTLALVYVFLDILHYVVITAVYKYILIHYFDSVEGGYASKKGKDAAKCSRVWMKIGFWWLIFMSLILFISSILLIVHVWEQKEAKETSVECCCIKKIQ